MTEIATARFSEAGKSKRQANGIKEVTFDAGGVRHLSIFHSISWGVGSKFTSEKKTSAFSRIARSYPTTFSGDPIAYSSPANAFHRFPSLPKLDLTRLVLIFLLRFFVLLLFLLFDFFFFFFFFSSPLLL